MAELRGEAVHLSPLRVVGGEEALLEEEQLPLRAGGIFEDGDEAALEVDLDAEGQLGQGLAFEVVVVCEG